MAQFLHRLVAHIIFSTKERRPYLRDGIRPRIHAYLARILQNLECRDITVGGVADHVHVLCQLTRKTAPMKVLEVLKKDSSKFAKTLEPGLADFHWQNGYGLFSVSAQDTEGVRRYVLDQETHHRSESFQDELLRFLRTHGIPYDERYLWD